MDDVRGGDGRDRLRAGGVLMGANEGAMMAAVFAATYPERVSALVLVNATGCPTTGPDNEFGLPPEVDGGRRQPHRDDLGHDRGDGHAQPERRGRRGGAGRVVPLPAAGGEPRRRGRGHADDLRARRSRGAADDPRADARHQPPRQPADPRRGRPRGGASDSRREVGRAARRRLRRRGRRHRHADRPRGGVPHGRPCTCTTATACSRRCCSPTSSPPPSAPPSWATRSGESCWRPSSTPARQEVQRFGGVVGRLRR